MPDSVVPHRGARVEDAQAGACPRAHARESHRIFWGHATSDCNSGQTTIRRDRGFSKVRQVRLSGWSLTYLGERSGGLDRSRAKGTCRVVRPSSGCDRQLPGADSQEQASVADADVSASLEASVPLPRFQFLRELFRLLVIPAYSGAKIRSLSSCGRLCH